MRVSISFYFEWNYYNSYLIGELPLESQMGIISVVANTLNLMKTHYSTVKKVILETIAAKKEGKKYQPYHQSYLSPKSRKIKETSLDMHLISKLKSKGSFATTANLFNACIRGPLGLKPIGYTAIYNAIVKSNHIVEKHTDNLSTIR